MGNGKIVIKKNNKKQIQAALHERIDAALDAIGMQCADRAADLAPVDTGRLKGSMDHQLGAGCVHVGSSVEYAPVVEFDDTKHHDNGQAHFLRDAITKNQSEYKQIALEVLQG